MSDFIKAIRLQYPETIPVSLNVLPAVWFKYGEEFQRLADDYPQFFHGQKIDVNNLLDHIPTTYRKGTHIDEWGCVWENEIDGAEAIVKGHPLHSEEDVFALKIPSNRDGRLPHGFMYLRLLDLCGFEDAMVYFAQEDEVIQTLIDKVLEYNLYQIGARLGKEGEVWYFGDDLGMQRGLAIGAERWRKYLAPCYRKMYGLIKAYNPNQLIYMHTDGCIHEIMPDLMDCGVDIINPQFRANGLENLVRVCRKERIIPINLDLDRQLFPFANRSQIFDHVGSCVESLYLPQGGLGLNVEFDHGLTLSTMADILDAIEKYRFYKS